MPPEIDSDAPTVAAAPVSPPKSVRPAARIDPRRSVAIGALVVLVLLLIGVVFVLPGMVAQQPAKPAAVALTPGGAGAPALAATPPALPPPAPADSGAGKRAAETILGKVLRRQAALEVDGVEVWGEADYATVRAQIADGDARFGDAQFEAAAQAYGEAIESLDALDASRPARLEAALRAGTAALAAGDGPRAQARFEVALALAPANETARTGRARAHTIAEVSRLIEEGAVLEAGGSPQEARARYRRAVTLDAVHAGAREALAGVEARIAERAFARAMSEVLEGLEREDFAQTRTALDEAGRLRPDAVEVGDARVRFDAALQAHTLRTRRRDGEALERQERWQQAVEAYAGALAIDPNAGFARAGQHRALERARLHAQIETYIAAPARLHSAQPLANANRVLALAQGIEDAGPVLHAKRAALARLIAQATAPVRVRIESDGHTDVVIYRVGKLGQFTQRELTLRPGRYTGVGSRPGFRDVRREFTVTAGGVPEAVVIRCEERI